MFRSEGRNPPQRRSTTINCLIKDGGLGDLVCSFPAITYLHNTAFWLKILVWVPDYLFEFARICLPRGISIYGYSDAKKKYNDKLPGITTSWTNNHTSMRTHPVDYAFHMLCDKPPSVEDRNYPKPNLDRVDISRFNLPEKYVTIQAYATETVKRLDGHKINEIAHYCIERGYSVVWIGNKFNPSGVEGIGITAKPSEGLDLSLGLDLTNQTTVSQVTKIIAGAKCFIGMDGGLMHLAGFTDVEIVAGFTFALPDHLAPIRNNLQSYKFHAIMSKEDLACRGCQTKWLMLYDHDFRKCYFDDYKCVKDLKSQDFIEVLEKIL